MTEFVKLYGSILDSTVWLEALPTKIVWITMLAMADWQGKVSAAIPTLAKRAGVTRNECEAALTVLAAPDQDSKTKTDEGRRIREADGGWLIINHRKYRDARSERQVKAAERVAKFRQRKKKALPVTDVTRSNAVKRSVRTDTDADRETTTTPVVTSNTGYEFMGSIRPVWKNAYGGDVPPGTAKRLKPLVDQYGIEEVSTRLANYLAATDAQYASISRFSSTYGNWNAKKNGQRPGETKQEYNDRKRGLIPLQLP